ncbi:hypothetical protein EVAR_62488_1 [Eumeta japonica]|uniref:Uncharacterized protein n=1 Tax=Eumeta variegata TaxID=151549 RepID=A0A4C1ZGL4_EUMVA|nr:hypothetical protein EVAR_62488_1 [Eumeta japonica]
MSHPSTLSADGTGRHPAKSKKPSTSVRQMVTFHIVTGVLTSENRFGDGRTHTHRTRHGHRTTHGDPKNCIRQLHKTKRRDDATNTKHRAHRTPARTPTDYPRPPGPAGRRRAPRERDGRAPSTTDDLRSRYVEEAQLNSDAPV